jgi:hypothetical protein
MCPENKQRVQPDYGFFERQNDGAEREFGN